MQFGIPVTIPYHFRYKGWIPLHSTPPLGRSPSECCLNVWYENIEWCMCMATEWWKKCQDMLSRFRRIPAWTPINPVKISSIVFTARRVCIARTMPCDVCPSLRPSVCPSVRLSVHIRRYSVDIAEHILNFLPSGSTIILVFFVLNGMAILRREPPCLLTQCVK